MRASGNPAPVPAPEGSAGRALDPGRASGTLRRHLAALFAVDLRSLALFRIGVAGATLWDLTLRSADLTAHYTDLGVLPRGALTALSPANSYVSLHFYAGVHPALTALLFLLHAAAALALLVGYRTRLFTALCWYLGASLNARNAMAASMGGDSILSLCLFWAMFLPLGARFSVDARRADRDPGPDTLLCVSGAALLLQVCFVYWATAFLKSGELWWSGRAVFYALHSEHATAAGVWLRELSVVLPALTYGTLAIEGLGPFLAWMPIWNGPCRAAAVLFFWTFHAGLALFLSISLFPVFAMVAWLPFLPGWVWERMGAAGSASTRAPHPHRPAPAVTLVAAVLLLYVTLLVLSNTEALGRPFLPRMAHLPARILKLNQNWAMFAPDPPRRARVVNGEATLEDGRTLQLDLQTSERWKFYVYRVAAMSTRELQGAVHWHYLARHLCRDWKTSHRAEPPIARVSFVALDAPILDRELGPATRVPLFSSSCERETARRGLPGVRAQVSWTPRAIRILPDRTSSRSPYGRTSPMNASSFSLEP